MRGTELGLSIAGERFYVRDPRGKRADALSHAAQRMAASGSLCDFYRLWAKARAYFCQDIKVSTVLTVSGRRFSIPS